MRAINRRVTRAAMYRQPDRMNHLDISGVVVIGEEEDARDVTVAFTYYPGCPAVLDPDSPVCGPAEPESIEICEVLDCNTNEDLLGLLDEEQLEALEIALWEKRKEMEYDEPY